MPEAELLTKLLIGSVALQQMIAFGFDLLFTCENFGPKLQSLRRA